MTTPRTAFRSASVFTIGGLVWAFLISLGFPISEPFGCVSPMDCVGRFVVVSIYFPHVVATSFVVSGLVSVLTFNQWMKRPRKPRVVSDKEKRFMDLP